MNFFYNINYNVHRLNYVTEFMNNSNIVIFFGKSLIDLCFLDCSGLVVGILKIGHKSLYVFDKNGDTKHVVAPCVLDFYVHESRQRHGLGKIMFEHMLEHENLLPEQLAVDRPSEKLLGFLRKHYGKFTRANKNKYNDYT